MSDPIARLGRALCVAAAVYVLGACAQKGTTAILLPAPDGGRTAVAVRQGDAVVVLDQPYAAVKPSTQGPAAYTSNPGEVEAKFGPTLAALPSRPTSFTLYFIEGKDELSEPSKAIVDTVFSEIASRPVPDIVVIGHTDTVGNDRNNDALALQRAEAVRSQLILRGIAPDNVKAIGRGKRELLVATPDGVAEPRNRRVEILVR
jgi:outer membrane protein OmpA-like peptidoglycan-associated protein